MARCQHHFIQLTHVRGRNDNTARVRSFFSWFITVVIWSIWRPSGVGHATACRTPGQILPFSSAHSSQIETLFRADRALVSPLQEPEQFMNDRAQVAALCRHRGKPSCRLKRIWWQNGETCRFRYGHFRRRCPRRALFINSRYCFMVPQESCCCGRRRYAQIIIMAPATIIGMERICPMLMYCTHSPVNCASGWRKNSTMIRNAP